MTTTRAPSRAAPRQAAELVQEQMHRQGLNTPAAADWLRNLRLQEERQLPDEHLCRSDAAESAIAVVTVHRSKGLEFPVVFLVGMEQGLFPSYRSLEDPSALEEERRLCRAFGRRLAQLAKLDLLVIDDFAISPIGAPERNDLLELLDDRIGTRSTLITSQLPVKAWHTYLNDPTLADAILDRLVHSSHKIELKGTRSMRDSDAATAP